MYAQFAVTGNVNLGEHEICETQWQKTLEKRWNSNINLKDTY